MGMVPNNWNTQKRPFNTLLLVPFNGKVGNAMQRHGGSLTLCVRLHLVNAWDNTMLEGVHGVQFGTGGMGWGIPSNLLPITLREREGLQRQVHLFFACHLGSTNFQIHPCLVGAKTKFVHIPGQEWPILSFKGRCNALQKDDWIFPGSKSALFIFVDSINLWLMHAIKWSDSKRTFSVPSICKVPFLHKVEEQRVKGWMVKKGWNRAIHS